MSHTSQRDDQPADIDVSTRGSAPSLGIRATFFLTCGLLLIVGVMVYFEIAPWWILLALIGFTLLNVLGWRVRRLLDRGTFTWMRLALRPAKLTLRGDAVAAEAAYVKALARARRFGAGDSRRGVMLCELATYVKNHGRYAEALALYEESVAILERHLNTYPLDYFVALNNFAIYYVHLKNYDAAQRIMAKALDLTFAVKKPEASGVVFVSVKVLQPFQVMLHLNVAFLFMEMGELAEANAHLDAAGSLLPMLDERSQAQYFDHYTCSCALCDCEAGLFADAERELATVANPDYPLCERVRAILHRVRGEFAQAERLLRKYQEEQRKKGTLHRPEMLKATLEFAECSFAQGKHDEAVATLQEARSLVADFSLPADAFWRKTLETWRQRARELSKPDVVTSLEAELQRLPAAADHAIAILEKFRYSQKKLSHGSNTDETRIRGRGRREPI